MPSAAIQWDAGSLAEMDRTIRREIAVTGKEASECVKHAFLVFGISGRANTKGPGGRAGRTETMRQVFENPNARNKNRLTSKGKRPAKYLIQFLYQTRAPLLVPASRKNDPRRKIGKRRGLARSSWGWMMQAVFPAKVTPNTHGVSKYKVVKVTDGTKIGTNPFIDYHDKLMYLLAVHPDIGNIAMEKAANRMNHVMNTRMALEMQRVWHS
jgi:hypothetical protein